MSSLAELPDYRRLDGYQETMTRAEFAHLLETLYAPHGGWKAFVRIDPDAAVLRKTSVPLDDLYTLKFAASEADRKPLPPRYWRPRAAVPESSKPGEQPLQGLRVSLDPGHLGGAVGEAGGTLVPDRRCPARDGGRDDLEGGAKVGGTSPRARRDGVDGAGL